MRRTTEPELRRQIVRACRALSKRGLVAATDGNVSARLSPGRILVTPSGTAKGELAESALLVADEQGRRLSGRGAVTLEIHLHLAAYRTRPDIGAVVHAHPPAASAFTFAGRERLFLLPVLPEVAARLGPVPTAPYATPGTPKLGEAAAPYLRKHELILLAQHGALAVGRDPWGAYLLMEKLEQMALILKAALELAGSEKRLRVLKPAQVRELRSRYGRPG